ncbi:MAG: hypothetical protein ACOZF0_23045 [Thermodesulfobacteriota bacterium]
MISLLKRFIHKRKPPEREDIMAIAKIIGPLIDVVAHDIFRKYFHILLAKPITYIVPAVWGADQHHELDTVSKEINGMVLPAMGEIMAALDIKALRRSQEFAIGFLIRGLIISKIAFMVESARNQSSTADTGDRDTTNGLKDVKPLGSA